MLHVVCDITIAAENAIFGQTGPKVGSFDAGYGVSLLSRMVGDKKAPEIPPRKGTSETIKRGTLVKNIRLTGNPGEIECNTKQVKGLVLKTEFLKKA